MKNMIDGKTKLVSAALTASLLLGSSGYLFMENRMLEGLNTKQKGEISALSRRNETLSSTIPLIKNKLEAEKARNQETQQLLVAAKADIAGKTENIRLLSVENANLLKIKKEYVELRKQREEYISKIYSLELALATGDKNNKLLQAELNTLKEKLSVLENRNSILENKVQIASVLKTGKIQLTAERKTNKGDYVKSRIKKADRFKVTFELAENVVADPGNKEIYLRIKDVKGNLIENNLSGSFVNGDNNISLPYSQMQKISYAGSEKKVLMPVYVKPGSFERGTYTAEIFVDGHFSGSSSFKIK